MSQVPTSLSTSPSSTRLIIVAFALAIVAVIVLNLYVSQVRRAADQAAFDVYVLTKSLLPGDRIRKEDVKTIRVPNSFKPSMGDLGAISADDLNNRIDGKTPVERSASQGDFVTYRLFETPESRRDIDKNITPGKRLVSLPVNSRTSLPGVLREGMTVDIEAPFNLGGSIPITLAVMERVRVIALGSRAVYDQDVNTGRARTTGSFNTITIEVTPDEATQLSMIQRLAAGDFDIQPRNPADTGTPKIKTGGINPEVLDLLDRRRREATPAPRR